MNQASSSTTPRVLVVDDEAHMRRILSLQLERHGFAVTVAEDGEEALASIRESPPDLVITDYMMPHMDGCQLCAEIAANAATATIPIVLLTGRGFEPEATSLQALGNVVGVLCKPFSPGELIQLVQTSLDQR